MNIALTSIGCKLNQSEINSLKEALSQMGNFIVSKSQPHDIHIFNACSITIGAEKITRQKIHAVKRQFPKTKIFVFGCLSKTNQIPEINKIFKNHDEIIKYIIKNFIIQSPIPNSQFPISKTRVLIKIQDGCNFNCTYCVIPSFRGQNRSRPADEIIAEIKAKQKAGVKEIVLVGVNILQYQNANIDFVDLTKTILNETQIPRIRFSSLDPRLITDEFLKLLKNKRICPHLHLSLQSGSSRILKLMNRHYSVQKYLAIVNKACKINPLTSITTDIIVGFPSETKRDFNDTLKLVKKIDFLKIHIFPYSPRIGTTAGQLKNQVPDRLKKARIIKLKKIAAIQRQKFLKEMAGRKLPVLFEHKKNQNQPWTGLTSNYILVKFNSKKDIWNHILDIPLPK